MAFVRRVIKRLTYLLTYMQKKDHSQKYLITTYITKSLQMSKEARNPVYSLKRDKLQPVLVDMLIRSFINNKVSWCSVLTRVSCNGIFNDLQLNPYAITAVSAVERILITIPYLTKPWAIVERSLFFDSQGRCIVCRRWRIMGRFREAIVGNEATLVREFAVESLWRELLTRKILSEEQLENCQSEVSHLSILETAIMFSLRDAMHTLHYMQIYNAP